MTDAVCIYGVRDDLNRMLWVGQSRNVVGRFKDHARLVHADLNPRPKSIALMILDFTSAENANAVETAWIKKAARKHPLLNKRDAPPKPMAVAAKARIAAEVEARGLRAVSVDLNMATTSVMRIAWFRNSYPNTSVARAIIKKYGGAK